MYEEIEEEIKTILSGERYFHSQCTAKQCENLAKIYNIDIEKAKLVGITHDIAKEMSEEEKLKYVKENGIDVDEIELSHTELLHAKIGADICKRKFNFNADMINAISAHTTGKPEMNMLGKILFVADYIGEDRKWDVTNLKRLAQINIDEAIIYIANLTIKRTIEKQILIHPDTVFTRNWVMLQIDYK